MRQLCYLYCVQHDSFYSQMPTDAREAKQGLSMPWLVAAVLFLAAAYVLSIGPAAKLHARRVIPRTALLIYKPLGILYVNSPVAQRFFRWYLGDVWGI